MKRYSKNIVILTITAFFLSLSSFCTTPTSAQPTAQRAPTAQSKTACPITGCQQPPVTINGTITDRWDILSTPNQEFVYYDQMTPQAGTQPLATQLENQQTFLTESFVRGFTVSGAVATPGSGITECCFFTNYTRTPIYLSDVNGNILNPTPMFEVITCQPAAFVCNQQHDWLRTNGLPTEQLFKTL